MLTKHRDKTETIAKELLEKEIIFQADLEKLIGKRPFDEKTTLQNFIDPDTNQTPKSSVIPAPVEESKGLEISDFDEPKVDDIIQEDNSTSDTDGLIKED